MPKVDKQWNASNSRGEPQDHGLRKMLTYVFIALVLVLIAAAVAVMLVVRWWGPS
jgi:hypothetical protein